MTNNSVFGLRKWKMAWRAIVVFTLFDFINLAALLWAASREWIARGAVDGLWQILILQYFAGVSAIVLTYITGEVVKRFGKNGGESD
jgi:hypothetical protein